MTVGICAERGKEIKQSKTKKHERAGKFCTWIVAAEKGIRNHNNTTTAQIARICPNWTPVKSSPRLCFIDLQASVQNWVQNGTFQTVSDDDKSSFGERSATSESSVSLEKSARTRDREEEANPRRTSSSKRKSRLFVFSMYWAERKERISFVFERIPSVTRPYKQINK